MKRIKEYEVKISLGRREAIRRRERGGITMAVRKNIVDKGVKW